MADNPFRHLPAINEVLEMPPVQALAPQHSHDLISSRRFEQTQLALGVDVPEVDCIFAEGNRCEQAAIGTQNNARIWNYAARLHHDFWSCYL